MAATITHYTELILTEKKRDYDDHTRTKTIMCDLDFVSITI